MVVVQERARVGAISATAPGIVAFCITEGSGDQALLAKSSEGLHTLAGWLWDRAPGTARLEPRLYEKEERKSQEGKSREEEQIWVKRPGGRWVGAARGRQRVLPAAGGRVTWKATFSWS